MQQFGGCLCGAIRYRITGRLGALVYCHCEQCRRAQGVGFAANLPVAIAHFRIDRGREFLAGYRSSPKKTRFFCVCCGSAIYSYLDAAESVRIRAGTLDAGDDIVPTAHIYSGSKAPWLTITDRLKRYPKREPERP